MSETHTPAGDVRQQIRDCVHRLEHVLPGQAPIRDFVHHNTLHGFQHLGFREALGRARQATGNRGYLPEARFRDYYAQGRILPEDLVASLDEEPDLEAETVLLDRDDGTGGKPLRRRDVYLAALLHPFEPLNPCQLNWAIDEQDALRTFQPDLDPTAREALLRSAGTGDPAAAVEALWSACLAALGLEHFALHPEDLTDLSAEEAKRLLAGIERDAQEGQAPNVLEHQLRKDASQRIQTLLGRVGSELTLRGLLKELTGEDLMDLIRPQLVRHLSNLLDEGFAPWQNPEAREGLYRAWRSTALADLTPVLRDLQAWGLELESLPDDPVDAIATELRHLGLARELWADYLERIALELPGWSGMVLWRHLHPDYRRGRLPVDMLDYLAMRLVLERIYAQRLCREHWQIEPSLDMLRWYFRHNPEELLVRQALYSGQLPEFLAIRAERTAVVSDLKTERGWRPVAALIWAWRQGPNADRPAGRTVHRDAWPLFRLAQHLGLAAPDIARLGPDGVAALFDCLGRLDPDRVGWLWLSAYEGRYRTQVLSALARNRGRGRWRDRPGASASATASQAELQTPSVQVVFCMDDREEGIRRHLEELDPRVETLGAAAHFNVANNWRGLDDLGITALAPVIPWPVIPAHEVRESPRPESRALGDLHARRHGTLRLWTRRLLEGGRRGLAGPAVVAAAAGPFAGLSLLGKLAAPSGFARLRAALRGALEPAVPTRIDFLAPEDSPPASPESPRPGFTDSEQADRVQLLLRNLGLTRGFAPLVAVLGHGSRNQNNPHASAYNCGACSGNWSGPNARLVCSMANRAEVRALLAERGIVIPEGTRFVAGERDTCDDTTLWYDLPDLPESHVPAFEGLRSTLEAASRLHAQERCRRFASAPPRIEPTHAHRHVAARAMDISQVRPELGHATNACAFFGRRAMSRGVFFDRRAFLISYDPTQDPDGAVLERHLIINGAVGAGISLEYYFSASNDEGYGCGSKVTHNVAGLLGVMDGATSDLRTGLPRQMVEIHEAMRLLVVVEQTPEVLTAIVERAPSVAELVLGGWVQVVSLHPDTGEIRLFRPGTGWVDWQPSQTATPKVARSADWSLGHSGPRPPALVAAPDERPAARVDSGEGAAPAAARSPAGSAEETADV